MLYIAAALILFGYPSLAFWLFGLCTPCLFGLEYYEQEDVPEQEYLTYKLPSFDITTETLEEIFFEEEFFYDFELRDNWLS